MIDFWGFGLDAQEPARGGTTTRIPGGARVEVDGDAGTVKVLA